MTNYAVISPFTCVGNFAINNKNDDPYSRFRGLLFGNLVQNPWPIVESCQTVFAQRHPFMRREFHVFLFVIRLSSLFCNTDQFRVATKKFQRLSVWSICVTVFHLFLFSDAFERWIMFPITCNLSDGYYIIKEQLNRLTLESQHKKNLTVEFITLSLTDRNTTYFPLRMYVSLLSLFIIKLTDWGLYVTQCIIVIVRHLRRIVHKSRGVLRYRNLIGSQTGANYLSQDCSGNNRSWCGNYPWKTTKLYLAVAYFVGWRTQIRNYYNYSNYHHSLT